MVHCPCHVPRRLFMPYVRPASVSTGSGSSPVRRADLHRATLRQRERRVIPAGRRGLQRTALSRLLSASWNRPWLSRECVLRKETRTHGPQSSCPRVAGNSRAFPQCIEFAAYWPRLLRAPMRTACFQERRQSARSHEHRELLQLLRERRLVAGTGSQTHH